MQSLKYHFLLQGMAKTIITVLAAVTLLSMTYAVVMFNEKTGNYDDNKVFKNCSLKCQCSGVTMLCDGLIPATTPNITTDLYLSQLPPSRLIAGVFCNVGWENVRKLVISFDGIENGSLPNQTWIFLHNDAFWCLNRTEIRTLHIDISRLHGFRSTNFDGLENIELLDFSGCVRMANDELVKIFARNTNFAKLSGLRLSEVGNMFNGLQFTQAAANGLARRNVSYIDISHTETTVPETINLTGICETLTELNVSYTKFTKGTKFRVFKPCESLRVIYATGIDLHRLRHLANKPLTIQGFNFVLRKKNCPQTLYDVRKLIADRVAAFPRKASVCLLNCTLTIECETLFPVIEEIQAREYNLPCLDVKLITKTNLTNRLKYLDLSNNGIKVVNPHILDIFDNLTVLKLSQNELGQMPYFDETFSVLFKNNLNVTEIRLNENRLGNLPSTTFLSNTKLEGLYLSDNNIRQVTFDIAKLKQLRIIDLRNNTIEYLDETSIKAIERLSDDQVQFKKENFAIDLRDNPFICSCEALHFLQWFVTSPLFEDKRHEYHCRLNDEEIPMNEKAIKVAVVDCEKPIRRRRKILLSTLIPLFTLVLMAITIVAVVKKVRKKNYYKRLDDVLDRIHEDRHAQRFPVFLSYSSEDSYFVTHYVLRHMQVHLS